MTSIAAAQTSPNSTGSPMVSITGPRGRATYSIKFNSDKIFTKTTTEMIIGNKRLQTKTPSLTLLYNPWLIVPILNIFFPIVFLMFPYFQKYIPARPVSTVLEHTRTAAAIFALKARNTSDAQPFAPSLSFLWAPQMLAN